MSTHYDVIVIGGGHAGVEAAYTAANLNAKVLIITSSHESIGGTSCNPAIGGIGKTHIVKEIDVFDGVMPQAADMAAIHYRTLNKKKGKAVQATRVQIDKTLYKKAVESFILKHKNITLAAEMVQDIIIENNKIIGVQSSIHNTYYAPSIIVTTGTFLGGLIHIGTYKIPAGRFGDNASQKLSQFFNYNNFKMKTLKTGTPARLDGRSIDWKNIDIQESEKDANFVSRGTSSYYNRQISCGIAHTNIKTHKIIQDNIHLSSVYSGQIDGAGPRYCPSIEDKIYKFPEKDSHQIFVEPEGLNTISIYPNGISTALPQRIQDQYLRSINGFEKVSILRYGYAIEYQHLDPRMLYHTLEYKNINGLFFAGQINGTTGYEEAAGQGLLAGINAVLSIDKKHFIFPRASSYIGVMVDDLVSQGVDEPYRMFTSRSEFRTLLRTDNAIMRINKVPCGTLLNSRTNQKIWITYYYLVEIIKNIFLSSSLAKDIDLNMPHDGKKRSLYSLLCHAEYKEKIRIYLRLIFKDHIEALEIVFQDGEYQTYTERLFKFQQEMKSLQDFVIPGDFNFELIEGVSRETYERLNKTKPRSIHEIKHIDKITPAALMIIIRYFQTSKKSVPRGT